MLSSRLAILRGTILDEINGTASQAKASLVQAHRRRQA